MCQQHKGGFMENKDSPVHSLMNKTHLYSQHCCGIYYPTIARDHYYITVHYKRSKSCSVLIELGNHFGAVGRKIALMLENDT